MPERKLERPKVPYKQFSETRQRNIDAVMQARLTPGQDSISAADLDGVIRDVFAIQSEDHRNNWLELERWGERLRDYWEADTTGGGVPQIIAEGKWNPDGAWMGATSTWYNNFSVPASSTPNAVQLTWIVDGVVGAGGWDHPNTGNANQDKAYLELPSGPALVSFQTTVTVSSMSGGTLTGIHVEFPTAIHATSADPDVHWAGGAWIAPVTVDGTPWCGWSHFWMGWWPPPDFGYNVVVRIYGSGNVAVSGGIGGSSASVVTAVYG